MENKKKNWLWMLIILVFIVTIVALVLLGDEEEGEMVQVDMSQTAPMNGEGDAGPSVPLSETDENMEQNASNEERFGVSTEWYIDLPGGGSRKATAEEIYQMEAGGIELAFAHVSPGEYSEVYGSVTGVPGESYTVTLTGPGVVNAAPKTVVIGEEGYTRVTWRITQYGTYDAVYRPEGDTSDFFKKEASIEVK